MGPGGKKRPGQNQGITPITPLPRPVPGLTTYLGGSGNSWNINPNGGIGPYFGSWDPSLALAMTNSPLLYNNPFLLNNAMMYNNPFMFNNPMMFNNPFMFNNPMAFNNPFMNNPMMFNNPFMFNNPLMFNSPFNNPFMSNFNNPFMNNWNNPFMNNPFMNNPWGGPNVFWGLLGGGQQQQVGLNPWGNFPAGFLGGAGAGGFGGGQVVGQGNR